MRIYRDTIKSFFITLAVIVGLGLLGFLIGSYLLSPKQNTGKRDVYAPKVDYPNGPIKLTYWRTVDGKEVFDPILDKWKSYHPNVTVEVVNIPLADYDKRLYDAATSGNMPDMFMLRSDWLPRYKNFTSDALAAGIVCNRNGPYQGMIIMKFKSASTCLSFIHCEQVQELSVLSQIRNGQVCSL